MKTKILLLFWIFFLLNLFSLRSIAAKTPDLIGRMNDYAMIFDGDNIEKFDERLRKIEDSMDVQMAILILPYSSEGSISTFINQVYNDWKIGYKETDKGILLVIYKEENEIYLKIGKGLKDFITNADIKRIVNEKMLPNLKRQQYTEAINNGLDAIELLLAGMKNVDSNIAITNTSNETKPTTSETDWFTRLLFMILWFILVFFTIRSAYRRHNSAQIFFLLFFWFPISFTLASVAYNEATGFWLTVAFILLFAIAKILRFTTIDVIWTKGIKIQEYLMNLDKNWLKDVNSPLSNSAHRAQDEYADENYYGYLYKRRRQAPILLITIKYLIIILYYAVFGIFIFTAILVTGKAPEHFQNSTYKKW